MKSDSNISTRRTEFDRALSGSTTAEVASYYETQPEELTAFFVSLLKQPAEFATAALSALTASLRPKDNIQLVYGLPGERHRGAAG